MHVGVVTKRVAAEDAGSVTGAQLVLPAQEMLAWQRGRNKGGTDGVAN